MLAPDPRTAPGAEGRERSLSQVRVSYRATGSAVLVGPRPVAQPARVLTDIGNANPLARVGGIAALGQLRYLALGRRKPPG